MMRTTTYDSFGGAGDDDLLTTGEAAKLLNSSRQHVVDLCDRGELPFTTVGTHRRIRRADLEAIRNRTQILTRDQQRSLWLAYAIAGRIVAEPLAARALATKNLQRMRSSSRGQAQRWLDDWERLLAGDITKLLSMLVSTSPRGRELRQNSPFAGLLSDAERNEVLEQWQRRNESKLA